MKKSLLYVILMIITTTPAIISASIYAVIIDRSTFQAHITSIGFKRKELTSEEYPVSVPSAFTNDSTKCLDKEKVRQHLKGQYKYAKRHNWSQCNHSKNSFCEPCQIIGTDMYVEKVRQHGGLIIPNSSNEDSPQQANTVSLKKRVANFEACDVQDNKKQSTSRDNILDNDFSANLAASKYRRLPIFKALSSTHETSSSLSRYTPTTVQNTPTITLQKNYSMINGKPLYPNLHYKP